MKSEGSGYGPGQGADVIVTGDGRREGWPQALEMVGAALPDFVATANDTRPDVLRRALDRGLVTGGRCWGRSFYPAVSLPLGLVPSKDVSGLPEPSRPTSHCHSSVPFTSLPSGRWE